MSKYKHFKKPGGFQNLPMNDWITLPWSPFTADDNGKLESELYTRIEHNMVAGQMCTVRVRLVRRPWKGDPVNPTAYDECVLLGGLSEQVATLRWHYQGPAEKGRSYYWQMKILNFASMSDVLPQQKFLPRGFISQATQTASSANVTSEATWFTTTFTALKNRRYKVTVPPHMADGGGAGPILEGRLRVAYDGATAGPATAMLDAGAIARRYTPNSAVASAHDCVGILSTNGQTTATRTVSVAYTLNKYAGADTCRGYATTALPARMIIEDIGSTESDATPNPPVVKVTTRYCDFWRR